MTDETGFNMDPDSDVATTLPDGMYGANGEAELVSVQGKVFTFKDTKADGTPSARAGEVMRWVDFRVAIDAPEGKVFVSSTPWVDSANTKNGKPRPGEAPSKAPGWFKALGLAPTFVPLADEHGNYALATPVEGTKVLVTIKSREYENKGETKTDTYITALERRP